jgi:hypothetical protein
MQRTKLFDILIFVSIFFASYVFFKQPFEGHLFYLIFLYLLPKFYKAYGFPKLPVQIIALPTIMSLIQIWAGNNTYFLFFKIFVGIMLSVTFYYYVMLYFEKDVDEMMRLYLKGCYWVSLLGILQVVFFNIGIKPFYTFFGLFNKWGLVQGSLFGIRMNSIFPEPSQFAIFICPALFIAAYTFITGNKRFYSFQQSTIIFIALLLTTSSTGFIGIFFIIVLMLINYARFSNLIIASVISIAFGNFLYNTIDEFKYRVDSAIGLWVYKDLSLENVNSSSFVQFNNFHITIENFKQNPIMGSGIGSHAIAFDKYSLAGKAGVLDFAFNKADANSLFLRLLSETGIIGLGFFLLVVFRFYIRKNTDITDTYWIYSNAILTIIFLYLFRQGNYFINGFPFFVLLYYFNYVVYKQQNEERNKQLPLAENHETLSNPN